MHKLAFCFLIYDTINHEDLWNLFFKNVNSDKYTIYIHYKTDKPLLYFEQYKLKNCIPTNYEDQTIPLAYNLLFRTAYCDENNYKFIIVSGSCIPMKSFDYIYTKLTNNNYGYFNYSPPAQCFPNCLPLLAFIERKYISKSHNWFILNRNLVKQLCLDKDEILTKQYNKIYAPAEYFYYTYIKLLALENEIITTFNLSNGATTFTNWSDITYKFQHNSGLKNYKLISDEELIYLLNSSCLFGRKFDIKCKLLNADYIKAISS